MASLPTNVGSCTITGKFIRAVLDTADAGRDPDGMALPGLTFTFMAALNPAIVRNVSTVPPVTILIDTFTATTDASGVLIGPDGLPGLLVVASNDPDLDPNGWAYVVTMSGPSFPVVTFAFEAPSGGTVDLSSVIRLPPAVGSEIAAWVTAVSQTLAAAATATAAVASIQNGTVGGARLDPADSGVAIITLSGAAPTGPTLAAPVVTLQPVDQSYLSGNPVTFTATASGTPAPSVQWFKVVGGTYTPISGATSPSITLTPTDYGPYVATFTNSQGSVTTYQAYSNVVTAPTIATQPAAVSSAAGITASFWVLVNGNPFPTVQWQVNGVDIAGATSNILTLVNPQIGDSGKAYRAVVTNSAGSVTSAAVTHTVTVGTAAAPSAFTIPYPVETSITTPNLGFLIVLPPGSPTPTLDLQTLPPGATSGTWISHTSDPLVWVPSVSKYRAMFHLPTYAAMDSVKMRIVATNINGSWADPTGATCVFRDYAAAA